MTRGTIALAVLAAGWLAGCKDDAKPAPRGAAPGRRLPGALRAPAKDLVALLDSLTGERSESRLRWLAMGVHEMCGHACGCLGDYASKENADPGGSLLTCRSVCDDAARTRAAAAARGARMDTLVDVCTPAGLGLSTEHARQVSLDWLAAHVAGAYLADQLDAAKGDDRAAIEAAMGRLVVQLPPTAKLAGVTPPTSTRATPIGRGQGYVAIYPGGVVRAGRMLEATFTPTGAAIAEPAAVVAVDAAVAAAVDVDAGVIPDDDPTAMALAEGTTGRKDPDRSGGRYTMKGTIDDEQLARQQAIEQARAAGVLGSAALAQGGAFASLTGTGDIASGFGDDASGGDGVVGTAGPIEGERALVVADRDAPALRLVEVLGASPGGATLAVDHAGTLAVLPMVFELAEGAAGPGAGLVLRVSAGEVQITGASGETHGTIAIAGGAVDAAALATALKAGLDDPTFAPRTDLVVSIQAGATVGRLVDALDAALGVGIDRVLLTDRSAADTDGAGSGAPQVALGTPLAVGDLDREVIRRHVKRHLPAITDCYERQLLAKPTLAGTVDTQFFIGGDGRVAQSNARGVDPAVASCVAKVIEQIAFPPPSGGGGVQVNHPFRLTPAR